MKRNYIQPEVQEMLVPSMALMQVVSNNMSVTTDKTTTDVW